MATSATHIQTLVRLRPRRSASPCCSAPSHRVSRRGCAGAPRSVSLLPLSPPKPYLNTFSVLNMFRVNISEQKPDHVICLPQSLLLASFHLLSFNEEQSPTLPQWASEAPHDLGPARLWSYVSFCLSCSVCSSHTGLLAYLDHCRDLFVVESLCGCSLCLEQSSLDICSIKSLTSLWPLMKYYFLNGPSLITPCKTDNSWFCSL